jgi:Flp pilus assembly protein TadD
LLGLVTLALYWPATGFGFINYDDADFVTANVHVQGGLNWEGVKWAFGLNEGDYWHPLTWLSLMLDASLFGQKAGGFHFTNVVLHAFNGVVLFQLLRMLTGALWRSVVVAALFALHPLRVESVAWVTERKDMLSGCFGLLALIAYAHYAQRRLQTADCRLPNPATRNTQHATRNTQDVSRLKFHASSFYLLSLLFFACGLMSKAMLVTWPFVMLLLDYWPLQRFELLSFRLTVSTLRPLLREKIPFFVLSGILCVLIYLTERGRQGAVGLAAPPALLRLENALVAYARYVGKTFWPVKLAVPYVNPGHWSWLVVGGSVLVVAGVCLGVLWLGRRQPVLLVGWCWFLGTMIPVIGLTQGWGSFMADRFTYVPSIGVLILTVWGVCELIRGRPDRLAVLSVAGGAAIVLCLALTRQQIGYWRDSEALFRHAVEVTDNNDRAYNCLGVALDQKGHLDEAIRQFQEALRVEPDHPIAHYNLGIALDKKGQTDEAIRQFREAVRLNPRYVEAHYNLGIILGRKGQMDEAIHQYQEAIRVKPEYAEAHNDLGIAFGKKNQMEEAIRQFKEAIRLNPRYAEAHYNLGLIFGLRGQTAEAISQFEEALRWKPAYVEAREQLNTMLGNKADSSQPPGGLAKP